MTSTSSSSPRPAVHRPPFDALRRWLRRQGAQKRLNRALISGSAQALNEALNDGARLDAVRGPALLRHAAGAGNLPVASVLLNHGVAPDVPDPETGSTALLEAVMANRPALVEDLIQRGANLHHVDRHGDGAWDLARRLTGRHAHWPEGPPGKARLRMVPVDNATAMIERLDSLQQRTVSQEQEALRTVLNAEAVGGRAPQRPARSRL